MRNKSLSQIFTSYVYKDMSRFCPAWRPEFWIDAGPGWGYFIYRCQGKFFGECFESGVKVMWVVVIIVLAVVLLTPVILYNSLVGKRNQVKNIFATTDALLKKRYDLIPNIVATVKGYADHERSVLEDVTRARAGGDWNRISDDDKVDIDNAVSKAAGGMRLAVENYPDLKANENFMHLQRTLNELEEQISAARRAYNASVTDYNNSVEMFPTNIMASMANFKLKRLFEATDFERENVSTKEMLNN